MNVYLGANEIDPQTLGSLNLEGIYRGADEVWSSGDKYELITSNGNYGTIWHNLTEGTFVISRHPASDGDPNTWRLSSYHPIVIVADHDYGVDPADDIELGTYTDGDGNTVKQILAGAKNIVTTHTPGSISVSGYHVPQIEEYRELIRLVAPILASSDSQDVDVMNLFKVLRFSLGSNDIQRVMQSYQATGYWGRYGQWAYWADTYCSINGGTVFITNNYSRGESGFSSYDDSKFGCSYSGPSTTQDDGAIRLFRNIEETPFASYTSLGYCSHTNVEEMISDAAIIYSGVDVTNLGTYVSPLGTNNFYFPGSIQYYSTGINICAKVTGNSRFSYYWEVGTIIQEYSVQAQSLRAQPTDYGTSKYSYSDIGFQLNYPDELQLTIGGRTINLSYPNQRPSDYNKYQNPYIYLGLTPNNVYIIVADGVIPASDTSIGLDVTIDVSNNSDYQNCYRKVLAKKFVHIKGIEDTSYSGSKVTTAVNFGMPFDFFTGEAFVGGHTPWDDGMWRTFKEDNAEIL